MRLDVSGLVVELAGARVLQGVDIAVGDGEVVGIVGPNGSGKSTMLRSVYRVLRPAAGEVLADGEDVWSWRPRQAARALAVLVQEPFSEFDYTVSEIVLMGRTPHLGVLERIDARDHEVAERSLRSADALHLAERRFRTLSGGEKQRVLLARALTQEPRVLVLDEPTNHLDIHHQLELLEIVRRLATTTIAALHDLNLAARYCDHVCVLDRGRVVAAGAPVAILTPELIAAVFRVAAERRLDSATGRPSFAFSPLPPAGIPDRVGN